MLRAHAAWRASTVSSPNSAAVRPRSWILGVMPPSSATVRSSIATAVRVNAASVSFALPKSNVGAPSAFAPSTDLMIFTCARSCAPSVRAHSCFAFDIFPIVPSSSACV